MRYIIGTVTFLFLSTVAAGQQACYLSVKKTEECIEVGITGNPDEIKISSHTNSDLILTLWVTVKKDG